MRRKTHEEYIQEIKDKNPNVEVLGTYINANTKILHLCKIHNVKWETTPSRILYGVGCEKCKLEKFKNATTKSHIEYLRELEIKNPNVIPIEEYVGCKIKIKHKCKIHNIEWMVLPENVLNGSGCKQCGIDKNTLRQKKEHSEYIKELAIKKPNVEVVEEYKGTSIPILHRCKIDNYEWKTSPANLLHSTNCPICSKAHRRSHDEYVEEVNKINPNIIVLGKFKNLNTKIEHKCIKHNYTWDAIPYIILNGSSCRYCGIEKIATRRLKTHEQYIKELNEINSNIICVEKYIDSLTPIIHKCLIHNYVWKAVPCNLLSGHGCPLCKSSNGEYDIRNWLETHNIKYEVQKRFDNCKDKKPLPFDFYLPILNKCIEFDGKQHFEPIDYFGGQENLEYTQRHDQIKNQYCIDNNIPILRIPYYADIETELNNFLFN